MRWSWPRSGLYAKFILAMVGMAFLPISLMGVSLFGISERGIQASVLELHTKLADKLAEGLQVYLKAVDDRIRFTLNAVRRPTLAWEERKELLQSLVESHEDIVEVAVLNRKGRELLKVYNPDLGESPALRLRRSEPGFAEFLKTGSRVLWAEPGPGGPPELELYYPLQAGLSLRVVLKLKTLWRRIAEERIGGTGFALVVDRRGRPLLYPPERLPPELRASLANRPIVRQALEAVSIGSAEYQDAAGRPQVGAYAPIPELGGAVIIQQPKEEAYISAYRMRRAILVVLVVVCLAAVGIAVWMARRLTQPVLALTRGAMEVARGDFPGEVRIRTGDELQDLADTFNHMVAQLKRYADIQVDRMVRAQQRTEALLFSIDEGILMTRDDRTVAMANRRAREILGLPPEEILEGKPLESLVPEGPLREAVLSLAARADEQELKEVELSTPQYRRFIRVWARPVVLPDKGVQIGVVTALRDVTLEKQLDRMKEEFLHSITHDLRNPVGSIIGFAEFLNKGVAGVLSQEQSGMVGSIEKAATRLLAMVNNILDAAKLEVGRVDIRLRPISMAGVASHAIDTLRALAQRRKLKVELAAEEEYTIQADGDLIERVFSNLLGNAIKFAADNGTVTVGIRDAQDRIRAWVADDGEGIPPAYLERVFEKFEQVPGQRRGGTGLGLTICKHIVAAHLGRIWVESEMGGGARFYFTIPKDLGYDERGNVTRGTAASAAPTGA